MSTRSDNSLVLVYSFLVNLSSWLELLLQIGINFCSQIIKHCNALLEGKEGVLRIEGGTWMGCSTVTELFHCFDLELSFILCMDWVESTALISLLWPGEVGWVWLRLSYPGWLKPAVQPHCLLLLRKEEAGQFPMGTRSFSIAFFWLMILFQPGGCVCAPNEWHARQKKLFFLGYCSFPMTSPGQTGSGELKNCSVCGRVRTEHG